MTIADTTKQDKAEPRYWGRVGERIPKGLLLGILVILAGGAGIGSGILIGQEGVGKQDKLWIEQLPAEELAGSTATSTVPSVTVEPTPTAKPQTQAAAAAASIPATTEVIASKTGTVYYLPTCSGVSRILPANRVTYATRSAAEAKGLKPAKNCKGL
ncbi:MAG: hypothetical protein JWM39_733 [Parcubacteria group bacterium]|nr:hypothetical protein [Parcubacteria group bacterium]